MPELRNIFSSSIVLIALQLFSSHASAQDISGRLQLSAALKLAAASLQSTSTKGGDGIGLAFGAAQSPPIGLGSASLLIGGTIGYAVDDHWVPNLGARYSVYSSQVSANGPTKDNVSWALLPGLRYVFGSRQTARPFVGAAFSVGHSDYYASTSTNMGGALQTGLQLHVADRFSVDPFVELEYAYLSQDNGPTVSGMQTHAVMLSGGFALSVWL